MGLTARRGKGPGWKQAAHTLPLITMSIVKVLFHRYIASLFGLAFARLGHYDACLLWAFLCKAETQALV